MEQLIQVLTPIVLQLIGEFKHRNDVVTGDDVAARLRDKLAEARNKGASFLSSKGA
jgi:hypothetical protein